MVLVLLVLVLVGVVVVVSVALLVPGVVQSNVVDDTWYYSNNRCR